MSFSKLRAADHDVLVEAFAVYYSQLGRRWEVHPGRGATAIDVYISHMDKPLVVGIDVKTTKSPEFRNALVEADVANRYNERTDQGNEIWLVTPIEGRPYPCAWKAAWRYRLNPDPHPGSSNGSGDPFYKIPFSAFQNQVQPEWWTDEWWPA